MKTKQLNVWIPEDLRGYVATRAEKEECHMNDIITELIRDDIARRNGQLIERNILIVLQEIMVAEIRHAHIQLRLDLRGDWQREVVSFFERIQRSVDRLLRFLEMTVRSSSMTRRLIYASLAKAYGSSFARAVYDDAKEKVQEELVPKKVLTEYTLREDKPSLQVKEG